MKGETQCVSVGSHSPGHRNHKATVILIHQTDISEYEIRTDFLI